MKGKTGDILIKFMTLLQLFKEFCILVLLYLVGNFLSTQLGLLIPGSLVGMLILTLLLFSGILQLSQVEKLSNYLLQHLNLLFLPAGVGIMVYAGSFSSNALGIILNILIATVMVMAVTGKIVDWVIDWLEGSATESRHLK